MITFLFFKTIITFISLLFIPVATVTSLPFIAGTVLINAFAFVHSMGYIFPAITWMMAYLIAGVGIEFSYLAYQVLMRFAKLLRGAG